MSNNEGWETPCPKMGAYTTKQSYFIGENSMCPRCKKRGKTWDGDDPKCAFNTHNKVFSRTNWNCATMNALREVAEKNEIWNNDVYGALIPWRENSCFLALSWYKHRGQTGTATVISDDDLPHILNLKEAEEILQEYGK